MKKMLSTIFLLIILLFIMMALSGWYFGATAEQAFKAYLLKNSEVSARQAFRLELLDYRKTIFGAKARLKISSDIPVIAEKMGEIELVAKLLNGPLFITKNGISLGRFRWFVSPDEFGFTDTERENIRALFPRLLPRLIIRTDFDKNVHYSSTLHASFAQININGKYDLETEKNSGEIILEKFHYDFPPHQVLAKQVNIHYQHEKSISAAYKPGTTKVNIPNVQVKLNGFNDLIEFSLDATSNINRSGKYLNSFSKVNIERLRDKQQYKQQSDKVLPVDNASFLLMLKGLSNEGFLRYSNIQAELDNLQQQAQWSLQEKGEYPEGQDQIWQLYNEVDEKSKRLPSIILNEMFNKDSLIQLKAESSNTSGQSELFGELKGIDLVSQKNKDAKKGGGGFNILFSNIRGQANVKLDKELFLFIKNFLPIKQSEFKLHLKDSKLLMQ